MTGRAFRSTGILVALVGAAGCSKPAQTYEKPLTPVRVQVIAAYSAPGGARYSATVEPFAMVNASFKYGGYVERVREVRDPSGVMRPLQEGDTVKAGTVLAQLSQNDYREKVAGAESMLAEAEAGVTHATLQLTRAKDLYGAESLTKPDLDGAQAQYDAMNAKREAARAQLRGAREVLADTVLRAPIDGVVLKRIVERGMLVGPGTPAFALADTRTVKVVFGAPDVLAKTLRLDTVQTITTEAVPGRAFRGRITAISPAADPRTRVFDVRITIPNPTGELKAGMIASLERPGEDAPAAPTITVPLTAVIRAKDGPNRYAVFVVEERDGVATAKLRAVKLGDLIGSRIAVVEGVTPGERVVVSGSSLLADGERIRAIL